jgi:hypothetical protein
MGNGVVGEEFLTISLVAIDGDGLGLDEAHSSL